MKRETTAQTIARINKRGMHEQLSGPCRTLIKSRVVGVEIGGTWGHNEKPGPLDGQPRRRWECQMFYSDGTVDVVGSATK